MKNGALEFLSESVTPTLRCQVICLANERRRGSGGWGAKKHCKALTMSITIRMGEVAEIKNELFISKQAIKISTYVI